MAACSMLVGGEHVRQHDAIDNLRDTHAIENPNKNAAAKQRRADVMDVHVQVPFRVRTPKLRAP